MLIKANAAADECFLYIQRNILYFSHFCIRNDTIFCSIFVLFTKFQNQYFHIEKVKQMILFNKFIQY